MKILVDARELHQKRAGIGRYIYNLFHDIAEIGCEHIFGSVVMAEGRESLPTILANECLEIKWNAVNRALKPLWDNWWIPKYYHTQNFQLFYSAGHFAPLCQTSIPMAATIHDLTPFLYPRTFPQIVGLYLRISLRSIAHRAKIISVPSESTKRDLIRILGVEEKRIKVIYPSLVPVEVKIRPEVNPVKLEKYILAVGTNEPRKNLKGLIEAYSKLAPEMRREYPLVIAGRSGWKTVVFDKLLEEKGLTEEVLFTGFVEEEMLAHLYRNASVFCYVSLYEGFGYPPLEAMYYGAPVLVSNIASLPEVVGDAGMLVDPRSTEAIARGLEQLLTGERLRQKLRNEGRVQAQKFIKNGFAEKTLEMFDQNT